MKKIITLSMLSAAFPYGIFAATTESATKTADQAVLMPQNDASKKDTKVISTENPIAVKAVTEPKNETTNDMFVTSEPITLESIARKFSLRSGEKPLSQDSIEQAMISAYSSSPEIKEKRASLRAQDERVAQAKAGWRPVVNGTASVGYAKTGNSGDSIDAAKAAPSSSTTQKSWVATPSVGVELRQNIFNGGSTVYNTKGSIEGVKSARADLLDTEQQILLSAVQAYLDLITKYAELEVLKANEDVLKKTLEATTDKFEVGEETRTSVAQAQGQYSEAIARRQTAEAELAGLNATYQKITGRPAGRLTQPTMPKIIPANLELAIDKAKANNPAIIKAQFDEAAARSDVERINSGLLPKIDVVGSSNAQQSNSNTRFAGTPTPGSLRRSHDRTVQHSVRVEMNVPLYEGGSVRAEKRAATEIAEQRRIAIETQRRSVLERLTQSWEAYLVAKSNLNYYREQVKANEISLEGTQQELIVGSKILLDVLNAQSKLLDAQLLLVRAERIFYLSAYQIVFYMGALNAQSMNLNVDFYNPEIHFKKTQNRF